MWLGFFGYQLLSLSYPEPFPAMSHLISIQKTSLCQEPDKNPHVCIFIIFYYTIGADSECAHTSLAQAVFNQDRAELVGT